MKNGDMPANSLNDVDLHDAVLDGLKVCFGLTKREHFAGLAMQAMITKFGNICDRNCSEAVQIADELLKELEK